MYYNNTCSTSLYFCITTMSTIKNAMANNLPFEKKVAVISMLCESASRGIERITGVNRNTKTVVVHEVFQGKTVWRGDVEVFDLSGHPKAKRCYGWSYGEPEEFITILELPPVDSA